MNTIPEAKQYLREGWLKGVKCPCCNQFVKLYKRKLNASMARTLIKMYKKGAYDNHYLHHTEFRISSEDWRYLKEWGLIKMMSGEGFNGKTSGRWTITDMGLDFINKELAVSEYITLYNNHFYGFRGKDVYIDECLGKKFDYNELMSEVL